jgi:hypothetical protein
LPGNCSLFTTFCGHLHEIIGVGFGNFALIAMLLCLRGDVGFGAAQR